MEVQTSAAFESMASRMVQTDESGGVTVLERVRQSMVFQATILLGQGEAPEMGSAALADLSTGLPTGAAPAATEPLYPGPDPNQTPDAVSGRVLDFIRALAGGDPDRLQIMMDAAEQAFAEAEEIFGGTLPDFSYTTIDMIREGLAAMMAEFRGEAAEQQEPSAAATLELFYTAEQEQTAFSQYTAQGVVA